MHALVLVGSFGLVPLFAWLAHTMWPERRILGPDPETTVVSYWVGVMVGWAGLAILS